MNGEKTKELVDLQHGLAKHFNLSVRDLASVFTKANIDQARYYFDQAEAIKDVVTVSWLGALFAGTVGTFGLMGNLGASLITFAAFQAVGAGAHGYNRCKLNTVKAHLVADMKRENPGLKL